MGKDTGISWTDHTFNPWTGCTKVSPGCDHCYAETLDKRWGGNHWGKGVPRKVMSDGYWKQLRAWNKAAEAAGETRYVFCGSMCDVMDDEAPEGQRERLWAEIDATPHLSYQLLTKRPHRYLRYLPENGFTWNNVILMTTVERQEFYDPRMYAVRSAAVFLEDWLIRRHGDDGCHVVTGVSYEPALGPLSMREHPWLRPDWLICGGETGPDGQRRPMRQEWAESIQAECVEFGVRFFMKQMSARTPKDAAALIPAHLLIREMPEVRR